MPVSNLQGQILVASGIHLENLGSILMIKLEQLTPNAVVRGILPDGLVTVVSVQWFGSEAFELTYKSSNGEGPQTNSSIVMTRRGSKWWSWGGRGASTAMAASSASSPKPTASIWPTFSIQCWPSTPQWSIHCPTKSPPCTRLLPRQPLRFLLLTIQVPARQLWLAC
jgi:hypothetical protein